MARRVLVLCLLLSTVARADNATDALKLLDKGIADFNAGRLQDARESFVKARDLVPDKANPYRWLGMVDARLGRCADAVKELDVFLQKVPAGDPRIAEAVTLRDRCKEDLQPRVGSLVVESNPAGAEVRLDDPNTPEAGLTPWRSDAVPIGNHVVFVRKSGYEALTRGVNVTQREPTKLELTLKPQKGGGEPVVTKKKPVEERPIDQPPRKKSRAWIAGVVIGVVAVAAVGVGLGVGLTQTSSGITVLPEIRAPGVP